MPRLRRARALPSRRSHVRRAAGERQGAPNPVRPPDKARCRNSPYASIVHRRDHCRCCPRRRNPLADRGRLRCRWSSWRSKPRRSAKGCTLARRKPQATIAWRAGAAQFQLETAGAHCARTGALTASGLLTKPLMGRPSTRLRSHASVRSPHEQHHSDRGGRSSHLYVQYRSALAPSQHQRHEASCVNPRAPSRRRSQPSSCKPAELLQEGAAFHLNAMSGASPLATEALGLLTQSFAGAVGATPAAALRAGRQLATSMWLSAQTLAVRDCFLLIARTSGARAPATPFIPRSRTGRKSLENGRQAAPID